MLENLKKIKYILRYEKYGMNAKEILIEASKNYEKISPKKIDHSKRKILKM